MRWLKTLCILLVSGQAAALEGFIIAGGIDADSEDGLVGTISADLGLAEDTWLSAAIASSKTELPRGGSIDTLYADLSIDHHFDPIGVSAGVAYWGDSDVLDSRDYRGSLYWRTDKVSLSADLERRDFTFDIFSQIVNDGRDFDFHADGVGVSARFSVSEAVDLSISAIDYDYSINLGGAANRPIADLLSISRLSLLSSLAEYQGRIGLGIDVGDDKRWSLAYARGKGVVDARTTNSFTVSYLTPIGERTDIEFSLGVDRSEEFDSVTLFSVHLFFYG